MYCFIVINAFFCIHIQIFLNTFYIILITTIYYSVQTLIYKFFTIGQLLPSGIIAIAINITLQMCSIYPHFCCKFYPSIFIS